MCTPVEVEQVRQQLPDLPAPDLKWADDACICRHLKARKMDVPKAAAQVVDTLKFRREMQVAKMSASDFPTNLAKGELYLGGYSAGGEPVMVFRKRATRLQPSEEDDYIRFLTWTFEMGTIAAAQHDKTRWIAVLDMKGYAAKNSPALSVSMRVVNILGSHYPERLENLVIVDAPTVFWLLFNAISPFVDPVTRSKVHFAFSKKFSATGQLLTGAPDPSGLSDVWQQYKTPYSQAKYLELISELERSDQAEA